MQPFVAETVDTPLGDMMLVADAEGRLCAADFWDHEVRMRKLLSRRFGHVALRAGSVPAGIASALTAYFAGELHGINMIPVRLGGTDFQNMVWAALRSVEPGRPTAYSGLAATIGRPRSPRAVGHANGANPVSVVVPCHRLVGVDGALTGYAGGLDRKRWLLEHEDRFTSIRGVHSK